MAAIAERFGIAANLWIARVNPWFGVLGRINYRIWPYLPGQFRFPAEAV